MSNITVQLDKARKATREIVKLSEEDINRVLMSLADLAMERSGLLIDMNKKDLDRMDPDNPKYDRLKLTAERIEGIAGDLRNVAQLSSPIGEKIEEKRLKNGLELKKIRVPIGVIGIIYEARPNVTFDVFSLCFKTGNICLLKGGSDAQYSNMAIISLIHKALAEHKINSEVVQLLPPDRESTSELLNAVDHVDMIIPRGSQQLIDYVRENARVPVIETGAGIVHTYYDQKADPEKGKSIITNAKLRRVSVCNALDCLIIHDSQLEKLPDLLEDLGRQEVQIFADRSSYSVLKGKYPEQWLAEANEGHFGTEFLSKKMSVKTVKDMDEALDHIDRYSSRHSEAIISEDHAAIERFLTEVDAAAVYANTSTAFTDGAQFEMGAEIGISTQKLHARGPMALKELTSYKWIIIGHGQIRHP